VKVLPDLWQMGTSATIWRQHIARDGPLVMRKKVKGCQQLGRPYASVARLTGFTASSSAKKA
jgi:hypothetical protein